MTPVRVCLVLHGDIKLLDRRSAPKKLRHTIMRDGGRRRPQKLTGEGTRRQRDLALFLFTQLSALAIDLTSIVVGLVRDIAFVDEELVLATTN